jgi:hypothetical protein
MSRDNRVRIKRGQLNGQHLGLQMDKKRTLDDTTSLLGNNGILENGFKVEIPRSTDISSSNSTASTTSTSSSEETSTPAVTNPTKKTRHNVGTH